MEPGIVSCRKSATSEVVKFNLLKRRPTPADGLPELVVPHGLDPQRQWYLYENIRQFFKKPEACDQVCPKPIMPKPVVKVESDESNEVCGGKRKNALLK